MAVAEGRRVERPGVLHLRVFRVVVLADAISIFGTGLARFALAYLVFDRTNSAAASAVTWAATYLPSAAGGFLLGRLGDRYSQRSVMIFCDVLRALLFGSMALPGMGIPAILALLVLAVFLDPAFDAAELTLLSRLLSPEQLRASSAFRSTMDQVAQIASFALGGALVTAVGARTALALDAVTFVVSALLVLLFLRPPRQVAGAVGVEDGQGQGRSYETRPPDDVACVPPADTLVFVESGARAGRAAFRGLWRDARTRVHMSFTMLIGIYLVPEALAVSYAHQIGATASQASVLLAMGPLGSAVGYALIAHVPTRFRAGAGSAMALLCGLPLVACVAGADYIVSCVTWFATGLLTAYQVDVLMSLIRAIPDEATSHHLGHLGAWLTISQGGAFAVAGVVALWLAPGAVVAAAGVLGCGIAGLLVRVAGTSGVDAPLTAPSSP